MAVARDRPSATPAPSAPPFINRYLGLTERVIVHVSFIHYTSAAFLRIRGRIRPIPRARARLFTHTRTEHFCFDRGVERDR